MRNSAKFRADWSNGCQDIAIFGLFRILKRICNSQNGDVIGAHQNLNDSRDLTTPPLGTTCRLWASTCHHQPNYQI